MPVKNSHHLFFSSPRRSLVIRSATTIVTVVGLTAIVLTGMTASFASTAPSQTTFVTGSFSGSSAGGGYILPNAPRGTNGACLTASANTTTTAANAIPGCALTNQDPAGSGALRLTSAQTWQTGGVGASQSLPITKGIDASFNSYQYNGTNNWSGNTGDGIGFYLAATDPFNPVVPSQIGQLGGSLGYSNVASGGSGLSHAYLGVGIDRYGNFVTPSVEGTDCTGNTNQRSPNSVTVRGPGNGMTGYCLLATTAGTTLSGPLSATGVTDRSQAVVPVEIVINPTSTTLVAQEAPSVTVSGGMFAVIFTPIGGSQQVLSGTLPKLSPTNNDADIPASWIDPSTGYPYKLTYGWVSSTGSATDIHEVSSLHAETAAGPVPVLSAGTKGTLTVSNNGSGTYTLVPTVTTGGGSETQLIRATTTFPQDIQPSVTTTPGTGWNCTISGQVETCDYAVSATNPLPSGTNLPALSLPFTASGTPGPTTVSTVMASTDTEAFTTSQTVNILQATHVTANNASSEYGTAATLSATGLPAGATGTLTFLDNGSSLCSVSLPSTSCLASSSLTPGTYPVTAHYSGDSVYSSSTSSAAQLTVMALSTTPPASSHAGSSAAAATGSGSPQGAIVNPSRNLANTGSSVGFGAESALALIFLTAGLSVLVLMRRNRRINS